jgi:hypothetical protein
MLRICPSGGYLDVEVCKSGGYQNMDGLWRVPECEGSFIVVDTRMWRICPSGGYQDVEDL